MRRIYLVRHGQPAFPDGVKLCLGVTDVPLGRMGRMQAALAGAELASAGLSAVFASPLSRAAQTAGYIAPDFRCLDDLREAYEGDWEGLSFGEIRARWPELYRLRGEDPGLPPPGSESYESRRGRFSAALDAALENSSGDIAAVAHSGVIKAFLGGVLCIPPREFMALPLPYGSVTALREDGGVFSVEYIGRAPHPPLSDGLCETLMECAGAPAEVVSHCRAAADTADRLTAELSSAGLALDGGLVRSAALVHDIARTQPGHAAAGADWLDALGYPAQAEIVRRHMDCPGEALDEAAVVYMADKLTAGRDRVTLRERFEKSEKKCLTPEAKAAHEARRLQAYCIAKKINDTCGKEIIV
jgi:broad specificity phosphatase PhoE/HD superfamily phosphohydrolase YqeK